VLGVKGIIRLEMKASLQNDPSDQKIPSINLGPRLKGKAELQNRGVPTPLSKGERSKKGGENDSKKRQVRP